jgi:hypothetical protein
MMATTLDGNRQVVILAFAVFKSENAETWGLFFKNIKRDFPTATGVITEHDKGSQSGHAQKQLTARPNPLVPALCSQHIMENSNKAKVRHPSTGDEVKANATNDDKDLAWRIIKGTNKDEVLRALGNLKHQNPHFYTWLTHESRLPKCALLGHALTGFASTVLPRATPSSSQTE